MELRQLRVVVALAEHRHFGRAAAELGMTQPSLSHALKTLEGELGATLFERSSRHVETTAIGAELVTDARQAISVVDTAARRTSAAGRGDAGVLAIGVVGSALVWPIPRLLRLYRKHKPHVAITFAELTTAEQLTRLRARSLDVGFLRPPLPSADPSEFTVLALVDEPLFAALPRDHPLAGRTRLPTRLLADQPFVRTPRELGPGMHDLITTACREAGFEPDIVQEATQLGTVIALVAAGFGVSIVPQSATAHRTRDTVFVPLSPRRSVELALVHRTERPTPTTVDFVRLAGQLQ